MSNVDDDIDKILKDYRNALTQQMGLILSGKHRLDIKTADKMLIDEPKQKLATLIHQAEIKARLDELVKLKKAHSIAIFDEYLENHISALEKEIK